MMKIDKTKNFTIIDTYEGYDDSEEMRNEFRSWCDDMGYEVRENEKEFAAIDNGRVVKDYDEWRYDMQEMDEEDTISQIDRNARCIVTGSFYSRYPDFYGPNPLTLKINPVENFYEAIMKCLKNSYYYSIKVENGVIKVTNYEHDGNHYFEIRIVSEKTYQKLMYHYDDIDQDEFMANEKNFIAPYWELFGR